LTEVDVLRVIMSTSANEAIVVANGYLSRQVFSCRDLPTTFYMLGSMGLALSIGLGVALAQPHRRVVVIDGDGNLLMSLGALVTTGHMAPANLMHIVVDNQQYASTGGQASVSGTAQMTRLALAAGYRIGFDARDRDQLLRALQQMRAAEGPSFLRVLVSAGTEIAPRVPRLPDEIATTFRRSIVKGEA